MTRRDASSVGPREPNMDGRSSQLPEIGLAYGWTDQPAARSRPVPSYRPRTSCAVESTERKGFAMSSRLAREKVRAEDAHQSTQELSIMPEPPIMPELPIMPMGSPGSVSPCVSPWWQQSLCIMLVQ